jgi:acetylornithine deacetylase/succinyl-diaminopimelate desuccinylase-like protein
VENIIAKIEGTRSTKAIMLAAHYDSVPGAAGAAAHDPRGDPFCCYIPPRIVFCLKLEVMYGRGLFNGWRY